MSGIWGKLGEPAAISLTSSVPGKTITKSRIRQQVWDFLEEHDLVNFPRPVHKRIPNFKGAATAGQLFATLPEFKKACVVKVNPDKPQEEVRYQVLDHKKTLLVPTPRLKSGLFNILENPGNCGKEQLRVLASRQGIDNNSKPVPLTYHANIDIVVIGSVAVDKLGHRIGKGEGFADLEFALGVATGSITDDTIVVATVHDSQVFDSLPEEIFGEHDITVDIIVTPTTIHRVEERLPKPSKVIWEYLSVEKFKKVPILKQWKEEEERLEREKSAPVPPNKPKSDKMKTKEKNDKTKVSKEEGSEKRLKVNGEVNGEVNGKFNGEVNGEKKETVRNKRRNRSNRNSNKSENVQADTSENSGGKTEEVNKNTKDTDNVKSRQNVKINGHTESKEDQKVNKLNPKKSNKDVRDDNVVYDDRPLLYVGRIPKSARVRDLKDVLLERDVKPKELVWKGFKGFAFLYFDVSEDVEKIFKSLEDLKIGDKVLDIQKEKSVE